MKLKRVFVSTNKKIKNYFRKLKKLDINQLFSEITTKISNYVVNLSVKSFTRIREKRMS